MASISTIAQCGAELHKSLQCYCNIFLVKENSDKYSSLSEWENRIVSNSGKVFVAVDGNLFVGFLFSHNRQGTPNSEHIWLCGVKEEYRAKGVFTALYESLIASVACNTTITICSFPDKFPAMVKWLKNNNFSPVGSPGEDGKITYSKLITK